MIESIVVKEVTKQVAETFVFNLESGWLRVIVDENSGTLIIESNWGKASSVWPAQVGKLKSFLARMDNGYVDTAASPGMPWRSEIAAWQCFGPRTSPPPYSTTSTRLDICQVDLT